MLRFVDRLIISFPCTTRLSLDFFKSLVSISTKRKPLVHTFEKTKLGCFTKGEKLTITAHLSVDDVSDAHVDNTEKTLVLLLELLLVENLNGKDAVFIDTAVITRVPMISRSAGEIAR